METNHHAAEEMYAVCPQRGMGGAAERTDTLHPVEYVVSLCKAIMLRILNLEPRPRTQPTSNAVGLAGYVSLFI